MTGSEAKAVTPKRQMARLLRVLESAGGKVRLSGPNEERYRVTHRGRSLSFPVALVVQSRRDGLIRCDGQSAELLEAGLAHLRRLQHPEAGYRVQHGTLSEKRIELPDGPQTVTVNDAESPIVRLYTRKTKGGAAYLSSAEFAAGERLRADFERGRLQPRMTASLDRPIVSGTGVMAELSDFAMDARKRVEKALDRLEPSLAGVCLDVCCFLKGFEQVERERSWPPRSAKLMLRTALSTLARHYGLEARASARPRPVVHWGDADYRPSL